jgi:hypothetical protein
MPVTRQALSDCFHTQFGGAGREIFNSAMTTFLGD